MTVSGAVSRLRQLISRKQDTDRDLRRMATQDVYRMATGMAMDYLHEQYDAERIAAAYTPDPLDWLSSVMVIGRATIVTGLPDTGKTNLFFVLAALALQQGWAVGINIKSEDPRIHFFQSQEELEAFLAIPQPKLLGLDDAAVYVSSRRSGSKVAEFFRSLHVAARKPVPDDPTVPGAHLIWLTQSPDILNIDFRQRFTAWQLHKPSVELKDAAEIAHKKGEVPVELKRTVWAYFLIRDKDGKIEKRLIWWTDHFPKADLPYDTIALGEFFLDTRANTTVQGRVEYTPRVGDLTAQRLSVALRPDLFERLFARLVEYAEPTTIELLAEWLSGDSQRAIGARHHMPQTSLNKDLTRIRENGVGYAFEDAWHDCYPTHRMGGKNSPAADAIDDASHTVYSLKCYADPKLNLKKAMLETGQAERDLLTQGWTLHLALYELFSRSLYTYALTTAERKNTPAPAGSPPPPAAPAGPGPATTPTPTAETPGGGVTPGRRRRTR